MEDPIDVGDLTVEADDLAAAIEQSGAPDEITGYGESGDIIVSGDNDNDAWAMVVDRDGADHSSTFLGDTIDDLKARGYFTPDEVLVFTDKSGDEVWLDGDGEYETVNHGHDKWGALKVRYTEEDIHERSPNRGHSPRVSDPFSSGMCRWFETVERREV